MFTINEILKATEGSLLQGVASDRVTALSTDTRAIRRGEGFIAIKGDRFDGHDFIADIVRRGIRTVIVSKSLKIENHKVNVIRVKDTVKALGYLACFHRRRFQIPVIGVTGSAGKTTTKEMIAAVLKTEFNVLANVGTLNNHIGVPLTLLNLTPQHEVAVIEMGTNQPGDIPWLAEIAEPTMAVLTNIGESHVEKLKNLMGVFREKIHLAKAIGPGGVIIYNKDDRYLKTIGDRKWPADLVPFSLQAQSHWRASDLAVDRQGFLRFKIQKKPFFLKTFSRDMAYNALVAVICGRQLKIGEGKMKKALGDFRFERGRQELLKAGGIDIINDTYNANPVSMRSAIQALDDFPTRGRRILVCADMLELGDQSQRLHRQIGETVALSKADVVMTVGAQSRCLIDTAQRRRPALVVFNFSDTSELHRYLRVLCRRGDAVLVKGSRRMKMEQTVEFLMSELRK